SLVKNGGRLIWSTHDTSSPLAEPCAMKFAINPLTQTEPERCDALCAMTCRLLGRYRAAAPASHGGATGSRSPETNKTGAVDSTGLMKLGVMLGRGQFSRAFF